MIKNLKRSSPVKAAPTNEQVKEFLKEIKTLPTCAESFLRNFGGEIKK